MTAGRRWPLSLTVLLAVVFLAPLLGLFGLRVASDRAAAGRIIGFNFEEVPGGLAITQVREGLPAERAGFRAGDLLVAIDGKEIATEEDYDALAPGFGGGRPIAATLKRGGARVETSLTPGIPVDRAAQASSLLLILIFSSLALVAIHRRAADPRARLVAIFSFLLALEASLPPPLRGHVLQALLVDAAFLLLTGAQMAVEFHLASVIPEKQPWVARRRWLIPLYYLLGLGWGLLASAARVSEGLGLGLPLPFGADEMRQSLLVWGLPLWALGVMAILAIPAFSHPRQQSRQQAGLIFLGVLPWAFYAVCGSVFSIAGEPAPAWLDRYFPLFVLGFPISVFIAIYRYHLFDMGLVVKRSFLYAALTTTLVAAYLAAIGLGSFLFSGWLTDNRISVVFSSAVMFLVGLTFSSLRKWLQTQIDVRLFPERQKLRRRLIELASELPSRGTIAGMGSHLVERVSEIFGVRQATLLLADPKSGLLFTVAAAPRRTHEDSSISFLLAPSDKALAKLHETGRPVLASQILEESPQLARRFRTLEPELLVPLLAQERWVGLLVLGALVDRREFRAEEVELLDLLGHQIATSFENIRLFESATYESLTGVFRREAILELLDKEIDRSQRHGRPLVVALADLDFFKSVNDRYGHLAGDAVLKRVADELTSGLRSTDVLGRYGGEEFLLILPETDLMGGYTVAEKLRRRVEKLRLPMPDGDVKLSVSVGIAGFHLTGADQETRNKLIGAADQALYRAKQKGRNRVEIFEEAESSAILVG
jgi:diguanylate cyclase (GGDEF)-like protein